MPCGCSKSTQGDGKTKKASCTCQQLAANLASCCKGGKQPVTPKATTCYCKPAPPKGVETAKSCKCDETALDNELDALMDERNKEKDKPKEDKTTEGADLQEKGSKTKKGTKRKSKEKKNQSKTTTFSIRLSPEQLAATCTCGEVCDCPVCTCKPETLWKCTNPEETENCCVQLEGESTCKKIGKQPAPLKYYLILTPAQLAATCDCEGPCECELCTCKLRLKSCKIICLRRFKGKKTCPCVCFKSMDEEEGTGAARVGPVVDASGGSQEDDDFDDDEGDDGLGDGGGIAKPQVSCKCKYIKAAAQKVQEKKKPCGPPPPRCCPGKY